jgi:Spy/CpxP family protein refolding chaperone
MFGHHHPHAGMCGRGSHRHHHGARSHHPGDGPRGFGGRRPLRYLAHHLDLDEDQASVLAEVIADVRTERAQADVDRQRAARRFAESLGGESFDGAAAGEAAEARVEAAKRVQGAIVVGLERLFGALDADQRVKLARLVRTGRMPL